MNRNAILAAVAAILTAVTAISMALNTDSCGDTSSHEDAGVAGHAGSDDEDAGSAGVGGAQ